MPNTLPAAQHDRPMDATQPSFEMAVVSSHCVLLRSIIALERYRSSRVSWQCRIFGITVAWRRGQHADWWRVVRPLKSDG